MIAAGKRALRGTRLVGEGLPRRGEVREEASFTKAAALSILISLPLMLSALFWISVGPSFFCSELDRNFFIDKVFVIAELATLS